MRLYDQQLETRIAMSMAVDEVMLEFADDLEVADFVTQPAIAVFSAVRNAGTAGRVVTADEVCFALYRGDRMRGIGDGKRRDERDASYQPFAPADVYAALFAAGGPYETLTDVVRAVQQLRALRVRRDKLVALSEQSEAAKHEAVRVEQERRWAS